MLRNTRHILFGLGLLAAAGSLSAAVVPCTIGTPSCAPSASGTVGGTAVDLDNNVALDSNGKTYSGMFSVTNASFILNGSIFSNPDPQLTYAFGLVNTTGAPLTFDFTFTSPYVGGPYPTALSSHSSSVTDTGSGRVTVSLRPGFTAVHNPFVDGTTFGQITGTCDINPAPMFASTVCAAGGPPIISAVTTNPLGGVFGVRVTGVLSAGDAYSANGTVSLVPEPGTYVLFGTVGILLIAMFRRRTAQV